MNPLWPVVTVLLFYGLNYYFIKKHRVIYLQPVAWSLIILSLVLIGFNVDYKVYFKSTEILNKLLGPTTVAFAIPLFEQRKVIRRLLIPLSISLLVGSLTAIVSSMFIAHFLGASDLTVKTVAAKSITSPMAIGILEKVGGDTSLIASLVIFTGVFGAVVGIAILKNFKTMGDEAKGFSMGLAAHGIGTARAFQESSEMGAFGSLAIGLNGAISAILIPIIFKIMS